MKSFKPREPKQLIYGSHFSATEATYKVSQIIKKNCKVTSFTRGRRN